MHSMTLSEFTGPLGVTKVVNDAPVEITDLAYDTHEVRPGALFFCLRGAHADGHALAATAAAAGAVALVVEHPVDVALPQLVVRGLARIMAEAAVQFFRYPTRRPRQIAGVTGTNGKTTTAFLLHSILEADGRRTGLLTNIKRLVARDGTTRRSQYARSRSTCNASFGRWPTPVTTRA